MPHVIGILGTTALLLTLTLLPFFPGPYDSASVPLSTMVQVFGLGGLLLVPIGAVWAASRFSIGLASKQHLFALAAVIAASIVWLFVAFGALVSGSVSSAAIVAALWVWFVVKARRRVMALKAAPPRPPGAGPYYLLVVPVALVLLQFALIGPAIEFSRTRAIRNSAAMIADIEQYRTRHGRYPTSLLSMLRDYSPGVIGIDRYQYEPSREAYNLIFEQFSEKFGTREFVVYNPLDQQEMTGHVMDILQFPPEILARSRGYYAVSETGHPHWKSFWFD